jgi:MFS superfamily sulfate permease-like transporter
MKIDKIKSVFKSDLPAGLVLFLVALPLCLGVASASTGDPSNVLPGIVSGIVGGFLVGLISGSSVGVSGPAAGLIIIVFTAIEILGYEGFLLAVVFAGIIQLIMGFLKLGIIGYYFPSAVIKGMLAAIGIILVLKELPHAMGNDVDLMGVFELNQAEGIKAFSQIQYALDHTMMGAMIISVTSLLLLLLFESSFMKKIALFTFLPGALFVVLVAILLNQLFVVYFPEYSLTGEHLVQLPIANSTHEFISFLKTPDFTQISNPTIYTTAFTIAIVASLETLLSVEATDKLDPYKRVTPNNRELGAQGIGNIVSGLIGGIPITQVIVRSSANINAGGKTKFSTIFHGVLLFMAVVLIPKYLNLIPRASLAAILIIIGYKLTKLGLFKTMFKLGWSQFLPFFVTILAVLFTDLLKGIFIGMAFSLYFILIKNYKNSHKLIKSSQENGIDLYKITLSEEVTFLNKGSITLTLNKLPNNCKVIIDASNSQDIDFDVLEAIHNFRNHAASLKNIEVETIGIDI